MNALTNLLGGRDKVFLMRLFLREPQASFTAREIREISGIDGRSIRSLLTQLEKSELILKVVPRIQKKRKRVRLEHKWRLNTQVPYIEPLRNLLAPVSALSDEDIIQKFNRKGRPRLIVLSGFFSQMEEEDRILDLLCVGDRYDKGAIESVIEEIEEEAGEEIHYAFFTPTEFQYRREMQDKLLRELFSHPHRTLLNRLDGHL
jgi:hypothetical protein